MSKNVKLNDKNYNGVSTVQLPTDDGGTALFKDVDEIVTPSGTKKITSNGTHDVTNYASVFVEVTSGAGGDSTEKSVVTFNGSIQGELWVTSSGARPAGIKVAHGLGKVPKYAILSSDAVADGTLKGSVIGGAFIGDTKGYSTAVQEGRYVGCVLTTNINTGASGSTACAYDDTRNAVGTTAMWYWDEEYFYCMKPANNQNFDVGINYTLTCYA